MGRKSDKSKLEQLFLAHLMKGGPLFATHGDGSPDLADLLGQVDPERVRRLGAFVKWAREFQEHMLLQQQRSRAIHQLARVIDSDAVGGETARRACVALLRGPTDHRRRGPEPLVARQAARWLTNVLAKGPRPATEVNRMARELGIGATTLQRGKRLARICTRRIGFGPGGHFTWGLPEKPFRKT